MLSAFIYGAQICIFTKANIDKITKAEIETETKIVHITLKDIKQNKCVRKIMKVKEAIWKLKDQEARIKWNSVTPGS